MVRKWMVYPMVLALCFATACSDGERTSSSGDADSLTDLPGEVVEKADHIGRTELDTIPVPDSDTPSGVDLLADMEAGQLVDVPVDVNIDAQPEVVPLPTELTASFTATPKSGPPCFAWFI